MVRSQSSSSHVTASTATSWLYVDTPSQSMLTESANSLISIGTGLPLLSKKLVQQIKAGEFVNFCDFPPAKAQPPAAHDTSQMPILALLQLQEVHKKLIPDFIA